jgi:membrane-bound lytic murein transglycosylase A
LLLVFVLCFGGCARMPFEQATREAGDARRAALVRVSAPESLADDLPLATLLQALDANLAELARRPADTPMRFGPDVFTMQEYREALGALRAFVSIGPSPEALENHLKENFEFYAPYGSPELGDVFMTAYYAPTVDGSLKRTARFTQPLYAAPSDLLTLRLSAFDEKFAPEREYRARVEGGAVRPYYSRREIDIDGALKGRKLELVWVDPIDAFFIQIQGSAAVRLADGRELQINYANRNGWRYEALGKFFKDLIPPERMSMQAIEAELRRLPADRLNESLAQNPSYVFFAVSDKPAVTQMGAVATAGRTIATDTRLFPRGALAFLQGEKPVFAAAIDAGATSSTSARPAGAPDPLQPERFEPFSRLVLDQDTGGAIVGPARLDLFWGFGKDAARHAGVVRHPGKLLYLAPKGLLSSK